MTGKVKPLVPLKVKINFWNSTKLWFLGLVSVVLWITIIVAGANLLWYYVYTLYTKGFFDQESLKYAVLLAVGTYFCLILDKKKIEEALNIKKDLPFITIEQVTGSTVTKRNRR